MNIAELKLDLIQKITDCNDINLLSEISDLLEVENYKITEENSSEVNESVLKYEKIRIFTAEEQQKIDLALEQVKNGEFLSEEEENKEMQRWFKEEEERLIGH